MELYTLNINVNKQRLSFGENKPEIFSGDQSIDFVEFTFEDDMWNFPDIWAIFSRQKGTSYQVALEDNKVMIPAEVMQKRGYVYIGLMATDGENVQTSSVLQYSIGQGSTNVDAITPSASIYEQFLADLDAYQTAVADLDNIESRITTAEGNVSMIEQAVTDLNEQLDDINVDISTINGQITTIQNNIGTAQGDIVSIQNGINALNGQVAGLDTAVGTLSNRVTALQSSVTSLEGRLTTVGNTLTDFEGRLTTAGTTLTNLEGSISDAENDIQTVQGDIETIQSDIEDIQTAIEQNNVVTDVTAEGISLVDNHIADLSFMCVTDTASGDVASFPDGSGLAMKKAEVSLEPIQDLNGYDKPWAGGGGKNKCYDATSHLYPRGDGLPIVENTTLYTAYAKVPKNTQITISTKTAPYRSIVYGFAEEPQVGSIAHTITYTTLTTTSFLINSGEYEYIGFYYGNLENPQEYVQIELGSTATDYAPYSNICPIDGYEDVGVSVRGVNMWDEEWEVGTINTSNGQNEVNVNRMRSKNFIPIVGGYTYCFTISGKTYISTFRCVYYDADENYISGSAYFPSGASATTLPFTFTPPSNAKYMRFSTPTTDYGATYNNDISINYPSTDHDYHVYAGTDYTTDLGRTVYGGTVDLASGRLVVDRAMVTFDGSSSTGWGYQGDYGTVSRFDYNGIASTSKKGTGLNTNIISNQFPKGLVSTPNLECCNIHGSNGNLQIQILPSRLPAFSITGLMQYFQAYPLTVVYELATPQIYQLTPQQIQTLVGTNNVWSEDGTIEVEYIANLKDYIDKKINA